jgi:hypothetical protein
MRAKLPFMTRLPKKRGITQDGEDKSLILRSFRVVHCNRDGDNPITDVTAFA